MSETYTDENGTERCGYCTEVVGDGCDCVCDDCGDGVSECACDAA